MTIPILSIIIPVYNVEKYLATCVKSIIKIDQFDYELIIVNDGSTDSSLMVAKQYENQFSDEITIISQNNEGMASARNTGLAASKGSLICFVDSDDFIDASNLQKLVSEAIANDSDITFGKAEACWGQKLENFKPLNTQLELFDHNKQYSGIEFFSQMLQYGATNIVVWDKIYKREIIFNNKINFLDGIIHEDVPFCFEVFINSSSVMMTNNLFYFYRQRHGSVMHTLDIKSAISRIKLATYLLDYTKARAINEKTFNDYLVYQLKRASELTDISNYELLVDLFRRKLSLKRRAILLIIISKQIFQVRGAN